MTATLIVLIWILATVYTHRLFFNMFGLQWELQEVAEGGDVDDFWFYFFMFLFCAVLVWPLALPGLLVSLAYRKLDLDSTGAKRALARFYIMDPDTRKGIRK